MERLLMRINIHQLTQVPTENIFYSKSDPNQSITKVMGEKPLERKSKDSQK